MFLMISAPKVACVLHIFAMNMALYGLNLGCMNLWEVRWMLTVNNPYRWTMSTGKFSSALNWWTTSTVYQFMSKQTIMFWIDKSADHRMIIFDIQPWAHWAFLYFCVCVGVSTFLYFCTFLVRVCLLVYIIVRNAIRINEGMMIYAAPQIIILKALVYSFYLFRMNRLWHIR